MSESNDQQSHQGCEEYKALSRRGFFRNAVPLSLAATFPAWLPKVTMAQDFQSNRDVLVLIFLRGAMDGLTTCVPYADPELYLARPNLAVPPPGSPGGAIDLDGFFGLAPDAGALMPAYQANHLAFIHASGSTDPTRSHFDAFRFMEFGIPGQPAGSADSGWLARHLHNTAPLGNGYLRGVSVTNQMPYTLHGAPATLPINDFESFALLPGRPGTANRRRPIIETMYGSAPQPMGRAALDTFSTIDLLSSIDFENYQPDNGVSYNGDPLSRGLKNTAALIKADIGVETVMLELDGWDTHANQPPSMAFLLNRLASAMSSFYNDMLSRIDETTIVGISEFGRRVRENASNGTDHGHGNCMMVLGGGIRGGQVFSQWPGLAPGQLDSGDLAITIDYRDILSEILERRLQSQNLDLVFPNYTPNFQGITV